MLTIISGLALCLAPLAQSSFAIESISLAHKPPRTTVTEEGWGRDPFMPTSREGGASEGLVLNAIFFSPSAMPSAIINNTIVYKGGVIAGQKVIDIEEGHVILQGEKGQIRLEISRDFPGAKR
jgi:hypothetical protein